MRNPILHVSRCIYVVVLQRFHSANVSIHESSWSAADRGSGSAIALHADTIAFIRSGSLETVGPSTNVATDSNYLLAASRLMVCTPAAGEDGSCTIIRFNPGTLAASPAGEGSFAALSSPHLFLCQWHLLCWARSRQAEPQFVERAAMGMIEEVRAALDGTKLEQNQHAELIAAVKMSLRSGAKTSVRLERLASAFGLSPFTVSRAFHRQVGISMRKYGKRLRLRYALQLMLESQTDLSSIAVEAGFFDQPHFTNAFRQDFGIPPSLVLASHRSKTGVIPYCEPLNGAEPNSRRSPF